MITVDVTIMKKNFRYMFMGCSPWSMHQEAPTAGALFLLRGCDRLPPSRDRYRDDPYSFGD
jgi:hypothetical protein